MILDHKGMGFKSSRVYRFVMGSVFAFGLMGMIVALLITSSRSDIGIAFAVLTALIWGLSVYVMDFNARPRRSGRCLFEINW